MEEKKLTLADIPAKGKCVITRIHGHGGLRYRIMEMGFVKGKTVEVVKNAPLMDPIEYIVMGSHVSLRRSEAEKIEVVSVSEAAKIEDEYNGTIVEENISLKNKQLSDEIKESRNTITVALVGNPNCGKTSFFNFATGLHEKVGNYGGVTVDIKSGKFYHNGYTIELIDLPGTYSINEYSPEELCVREYLTKNDYDIVLNIVDASNLERNLYLTTQLIDMNVNIIMALNMYDEMTAKGDKFDYKKMSNMLGFPIIPTTASRGIGIKDVLQAVIDLFESHQNLTRHIHINYGNDIEDAIVPIKKLIENNKDIINTYPSRYIAINALENTQSTIDEITSLPNGAEILALTKEKREKLESAYTEKMDSLISNARYGFIRGALKETYTPGEKGNTWVAYKADKILTNKWLGFPILFAFMWLMFEVTFDLGAYPQDWLDQLVGWIGETVSNAMPEGILHDLIVDGIIGGVGAVISFLPNILILFLFISIMEDTGYMARAAFMMDKLFHKFGLHGRSFIPYIMGFGCGVPAIMATRTLENKKDRLATILTIPFMSCSARLPVYLLFVGTFFSKGQGLILFSIYAIGVLTAVLTVMLLTKTTFKNTSEDFVMELPPYRIPTGRNVLMHMWEKSSQYLRKMGTVILAASIIIWALEYFPTDSETEQRLAQEIAQVEQNDQLSEDEITYTVDSLTHAMNAAHFENCYIGRFGKFIEPAVRPCGFDWRMGVSLCTGIAAKEVVVSTLGVLYQTEDPEDENITDDNPKSLSNRLQAQLWDDGPLAGKPVYTPLVAYGFMIFVLLSVPCFAALAAIKREAGWKWTGFTVLYTTFLAWLAALLIYQIGMLF
ncbi:MAG: ferrous iron transport protein B [Paludibacteraceae bacterium]|nr:ferrous iron transport protein B [Paludibacteraceae bacterium]